MPRVGVITILLYLLIAGVVFVNGWTDAPGAITCAVATKAVEYKKAVRLAAVFNLLGIVVMGILNTSVAYTVAGLVKLDTKNPKASIAVLCAAMISIVVFAVIAWCFGIPTSESHALFSGIGGAALAQGIDGAIDIKSWQKIIAGLLISLIMGMVLGFITSKIAGSVIKTAGDKTLNNMLRLSSAGMAFMHGGQDGQKFIAVFLITGLVAKGVSIGDSIILKDHIPLMLLVAIIMAAGTLVGGKRIIFHVGKDMVNLKKSDGVCADIGGIICLFAASLFGVPISTTHTKTAAIIGVGLANKGTKLDFKVVWQMVAAWAVTFPVCGVIGYILAKLFLNII